MPGRWVFCFLALTLFAAINASGWAGDNTGISAAPVWQRVSAEGQAYHAIVLKAAGLNDAVTAKNHVLVVDTSASQVGGHRQHSLEMLDSVLAQLPADHRVRLFAIDVTAEPLSMEFAVPESDTVAQALQTLRQRVPLGATDLIGGLRTILDALPADEPASVLYIGDGQSAAKAFDAAGVKTLVETFRDHHVAISSYGIGPQLNMQLLGVLAVQTGGNAFFDSRSAKENSTESQAARLTRALTGQVFYPTQLNTSPDIALLPATPLPLREDRETIYLAPGVLPAEATITLSSDADRQMWALGEPGEQVGTAFLPDYTQQAQRDNGVSNGLAGVSLAVLANDDFQSMLSDLLQQGVRVLEKNPEQAAKIGERVRQLDGGVVDAKRLIAAAERVQAKLASGNGRKQGQFVSLQQTDDNAAPAPPEPAPSQENLIAERQRQVAIKEQKLSLQVAEVIEAARATSEPDTALDELRRTLTTIRSSIDISPEVRSKLIKQLDGELLATTSRKQQIEQTRRRSQERLAQREAQERLAEQATLDEERLENLIDRVRALMLAGAHGDDAAYSEAQAVADVAVNLRPGDGTASAARFDSEAAEQLRRAFRLRARRADQFLETTNMVELSHIPFPDEPPIRFPPSEVWNALTQRRKKWASVDLKKNSPQEQRINTALNERTDFQFNETPLSDALDFLRDYHQISIWIDNAALQDEGVDASKPITLELSGITLRSGLRLMLEPDGLTYIIEDEVMKITTKTKADEALSTRVYPVADLVVPIQSRAGGMGGRGGMMGGMGGGMMGGMGGGMGGGMMGGMGGMGGMGMGGGGMGGGFISVPPEPVPSPK